MNVRHVDRRLERVEVDPRQSAGRGQAVDKAFRRRMQLIRAVADERNFYEHKSLHFEKLKGRRSHQHSMRLNKQFRLIVEVEPSSGGNTLVIVAIEDYH